MEGTRPSGTTVTASSSVVDCNAPAGRAVAVDSRETVPKGERAFEGDSDGPGATRAGWCWTEPATRGKLHTVKAQIGYIVELTGTVQGVGFRPFVHRLATELGLAGVVCNRGAQVYCEVEGQRALLDAFVDRLTCDAPPLATVLEVSSREVDPVGHEGFTILPSAARHSGVSSIPSDTAPCEACLAEFRDLSDRRFSYPFTCCADCGPRYTVLRGLPYDRSRTSLADFILCDLCRAEFDDPNDRRFHAQATCCPTCGPQLLGTLADTVARLVAGDIVAVKGVGGFQLVCRADQPDVVQLLRDRKHREEKPFALLVASLGEAERLVHLDTVSKRALTAPEAPIVLVPAKPDLCIAPQVAPGTGLLGVMLPASPLHALLADKVGAPLVCTSGNLSNEPIIIDDGEAAAAFARIADGVLTHDRPIERRADDSVGQVVAGRFQLLRRARGFAPRAVSVPANSQPVLGLGAELKSTTCLAVDDLAEVSVHLGDLENLATLRAFEATISDQLSLAHIEPALVVHDLHPEYLSTKFAMAQDIAPTLAVQHHHAHMVSCLIDNQHLGPAIGVTFDGLGWGTDNTAWGGEFLVGDASGFDRAAHLAPVPMPGGRAAVTAPWRMAVAHLVAAFGELPNVPMFRKHEAQLAPVVSLSRAGASVETSSMGRLFDAVAALCGVADTVSYEGQAAIGLEQLAAGYREDVHGYDWNLDDSSRIATSSLVTAIFEEVGAGADYARVARRFHQSVADLVSDTCVRLRESTGVNVVALSGGVFQNRLLVELVVPRLSANGFTELRHHQVPPNDGGISLGQVAIGRAHLDAIGT